MYERELCPHVCVTKIHEYSHKQYLYKQINDEQTLLNVSSK